MNNTGPTLSENRTTYDLHIHSHWSYDATLSVAEIFEKASAYNLKTIAITDHHHLDSLTEINTISKQYPEINCIPSAEFTVTTSIGSVDLLCYGFPKELDNDTKKIVDKYHLWQQETGMATVRGLQALGFKYTDDDWHNLLKSYRPQKVFPVQGYTHVMGRVEREYFLKNGFIQEEKERGELYEKMNEKIKRPLYPRVEEVIPTLKQAGALVVIAHPFGYFNKNDLKRMDRLKAECDLDGIECAHPSIPPEFTPFYREYCKRNNLLSTAGTDCHISTLLEARFGRHIGSEDWCKELLEKLNHKNC